MDAKIFWLIGFALIGIVEGTLTFARRYKNSNGNAGYGVAGWSVLFLLLWLFAGLNLMK